MRPVHRVSTSSNKLRFIKTNTGSNTVVQFCDLDITDSLLIKRCVIVGPDCDRGSGSSRSDASLSPTGTVSARLDRELSPSRRVLSPQCHQHELFHSYLCIELEQPTSEIRRRTRPDTVVPSLEAGEAAGNGVNLERPDEALDARGMLSYGDPGNPITR